MTGTENLIDELSRLTRRIEASIFAGFGESAYQEMKDAADVMAEDMLLNIISPLQAAFPDAPPAIHLQTRMLAHAKELQRLEELLQLQASI